MGGIYEVIKSKPPYTQHTQPPCGGDYCSAQLLALNYLPGIEAIESKFVFLDYTADQLVDLHSLTHCGWNIEMVNWFIVFSLLFADRGTEISVCVIFLSSL